ncbi:YraN family protein [Paenibacillus koleovorans]|uniref:YraN family protein n=1 Tax=Paenibacillus koleovorans TaxID=121608 RepID=UPI001FE6EFD6|nr:YraN family protein [Paenibacillus koleovorans]
MTNQQHQQPQLQQRRDNRRALGNAGEALAADFLLSAGWRIIERNWRCRTGELDLVAASDDMLLFVEVRTRTHSSKGSFGTARESVDPRKQRQVRLTAQTYMHMKRLDDSHTIRFDVICVTIQPEAGGQATLEYIEGAF